MQNSAAWTAALITAQRHKLYSTLTSFKERLTLILKIYWPAWVPAPTADYIDQAGLVIHKLEDTISAEGGVRGD